MQRFVGICRGGPFDGKWLEWSRHEYRAAVLPPLSITMDPDICVTVNWGTYRHVLGQWIWRQEKGRPAEGTA
jgi:hypothetical protein